MESSVRGTLLIAAILLLLPLAIHAADTTASLPATLSAGATAPAVADALRDSMYWGDVGDPEGLSLDEVLRIAHKNNPNWETYAANHAAAYAELCKAVAWPNPEFEIEGGSAVLRDRDEDGNRPRRSTLGLSLSQPIELPGKRLARRVEAEAGFAVADAETCEFSAALRADVVEAYYTVQHHGATERLWKTLLDLAGELHKIAKKRVDLGEAGSIEEINARVEVLKAQRECDSARSRRAGAVAALNALTGGRLGKNVRLADGLPGELPQRPLAKAVDTALAAHPRLCKLKAELEHRYASIDRARTEWWPDVKLGVHSNREYDTKGAAVTAGVEIPLWNRNRGGIAAAEAEAKKTYAAIVVAFGEIRRDVEIAYQNYEVARTQIASYQNGLKTASEEAVSVAWVQYREGQAGYLDVLTARRLLQETEQECIQARLDAGLAIARLDRATGKLIAAKRAGK